MGIRITTDDYGVRVWRSDNYGRPTYSISIQTKTEDGSYIRDYKQVKFKGGVELENNREIIIRDAFPTLDTWNDKQTGELKKKEVWVIMDFVYKNAAPKQPVQREYRPIPEYDDLPDTFEAVEDSVPF